MSVYVLDTSALLAYIENEEGTDGVGTLLLEAMDGKHTLYVSIVSFIEVFYVSSREQGASIAAERLGLLSNLPIVQETISDEMVSVIGEIKASNVLSFADCCIAGLALQKQAILMHKDPEFEQVPGLVQHRLEYKPKK